MSGWCIAHVYYCFHTEVYIFQLLMTTIESKTQKGCAGNLGKNCWRIWGYEIQDGGALAGIQIINEEVWILIT